MPANRGPNWERNRVVRKRQARLRERHPQLKIDKNNKRVLQRATAAARHSAATGSDSQPTAAAGVSADSQRTADAAVSANSQRTAAAEVSDHSQRTRSASRSSDSSGPPGLWSEDSELEEYHGAGFVPAQSKAMARPAVSVAAQRGRTAQRGRISVAAQPEPKRRPRIPVPQPEPKRRPRIPKPPPEPRRRTINLYSVQRDSVDYCEDIIDPSSKRYSVCVLDFTDRDGDRTHDGRHPDIQTSMINHKYFPKLCDDLARMFRKFLYEDGVGGSDPLRVEDNTLNKNNKK